MTKEELRKEVTKLSKPEVCSHPIFEFIFDNDFIKFNSDTEFGFHFWTDYKIVKNIERLVYEVSLFLTTNNLKAEDNIDLLLLNFGDGIYID